VIRLPPTPEDELTQWPFAHDLAENFEQLFRRIDGKSEEWIVLYDHKSARTSYSPRIGSHGFRPEEFRIVLSIVTSRVNTSRFIEYLETTRKIDVMHWNPPELIDGPYLREVAWRTTCPKTQWYSEVTRGRGCFGSVSIFQVRLGISLRCVFAGRGESLYSLAMAALCASSFAGPSGYCNLP
jgi:hypothetical protein